MERRHRIAIVGLLGLILALAMRYTLGPDTAAAAPVQHSGHDANLPSAAAAAPRQ